MMTEAQADRDWIVKWGVVAIVFLWMGGCAGAHGGYKDGYAAAKEEMPSCLYLRRPSGSDVRPLGFDGKEGTDWFCFDIHGGGYYVSLEQWKKGAR